MQLVVVAEKSLRNMNRFIIKLNFIIIFKICMNTLSVSVPIHYAALFAKYNPGYYQFRSFKLTWLSRPKIIIMRNLTVAVVGYNNRPGKWIFNFLLETMLKKFAAGKMTHIVVNIDTSKFFNELKDFMVSTLFEEDIGRR